MSETSRAIASGRADQKSGEPTEHGEEVVLLTTGPLTYDRPGRYPVAAKVIGTFGNDTMTPLAVNVRGGLVVGRGRVMAIAFG